MPKKSKTFTPPFGSKLVLSSACADVEIKFEGEDTGITIRPYMEGDMAVCDAESLAKTLALAARLACGG